MSGLINEIVKVDVENITELEEIENLAEGKIAVFFDREELVIKNDREKSLKHGDITTIGEGDFNGIRENYYLYIKKEPSKGLIAHGYTNYPKGTDEFNKHFKRMKKAGLK